MDVWDSIKLEPQKGARLLVEQFGSRLQASAELLCGDVARAEDLTFKTFEQALRNIRQYRPTGSFYSWLFRILLNLYRMELRKVSTTRLIFTDVLPDVPDVQGDVVAEVIAQQTSEQVRVAVAELAPPLREVVLLRFFDDLSLDEIASLLQIQVGTVKSRLFTAKAQLFKALKGRA